ncbi:hypothetical protein FA13DRAFT_1724714 [Coprinellus micaceus]|uniref:Uncharacterized protein n=1 Tax=Coprinellus micaceus TaxID=71717 RepID=A0A4Y7TXQ7_COPMI|nr:hypothetical protein FA13DRAFT_1724714 [Coprinellus micaceus]
MKVGLTGVHMVYYHGTQGLNPYQPIWDTLVSVPPIEPVQCFVHGWQRPYKGTYVEQIWLSHFHDCQGQHGLVNSWDV